MEIMRIFKDLGMVEHLGSGVPRILESYDRKSFHFSDNFLRMVFPSSGMVTEQVTEQVTILLGVIGTGEYTGTELMKKVGLKHRPTFLYNYLQPALDLKLIEMTIPDKPKSRLQKYRLTQKGQLFKKQTGLK